MKHIILEANNTDAVVFDIKDLEGRFRQLTDTRDLRGKIYPLNMILTLAILAKLAGEDKPSGITEWIRLRYVQRLQTGKESTEVIFVITSCASEMASAEQMLQWTRDYWGIENGLHYRRDVTLHEDATRTSETSLAKTIAAINNFVVGLSQKLGYSNLASARRTFNAEIATQLL